VTHSDIDFTAGLDRMPANLYVGVASFPRFSPVAAVPHCRLAPSVVLRLGELAGVIYRQDKTQQGVPRTYIHFFTRNLPWLVSNLEGTQLYLVGGRYQVTRHGIQNGESHGSPQKGRTQ
jgi:hypothetical protein